MNTDCPFCKIPVVRILAANEHAIAFADGFPISKGHTLVVPLRHSTSIFDLPANEQASLWELVGKVRLQLAEAEHPDGFNIGVNDGTAAGQTVNHGHIHIIPRYTGDVVEPRGGIRWIIPEKARYWTD